MQQEPSGPLGEPAGIAVAAGPCLDTIPDIDDDGLSDACERALAAAFAPQLMLHATRCTLPAAGNDDRIAGGYFHAAQPVRGVVRLVYMPAYYRDCGWSGFKCAFVDCSGHAGDSEMIAIDVHRTSAGTWVTEAVFLSAHCDDDPGSECRWYRGDDLDRFEWLNGIERGAPIVWVSDARNANYPSLGACERGHWWMDRCNPDAVPFRFPVAPERNIGSRHVPIVEEGQPRGCVSGRFVDPADGMIVDHESLECFWDPSATFGGWQGAHRGATAYGTHLRELGF